MKIRYILFILLVAVALRGYAEFSYVYGKDPDMTAVDTSYINVTFMSIANDFVAMKIMVIFAVDKPSLSPR